MFVGDCATLGRIVARFAVYKSNGRFAMGDYWGMLLKQKYKMCTKYNNTEVLE